MYRQPSYSYGIDEPLVALSRLNFERVQQEAARARLLDLARSAPSAERLHLTALVRRWCAGLWKRLRARQSSTPAAAVADLTAASQATR